MPGPTGDDYVAFVTARQGPLLRAAYLICGDEHLAHDLLQDALIKLASRWERLRDEAPEAYVRRILYRDAISRWRRTRRERLVDQHDPGGELARLRTREPVEGWVEGAHVRQALLLLPPRQRAVVVLRYYEDLSEADIATTLGISRGTVKSQASDAMTTLRGLLPEVEGWVPRIVRGEERGTA
ncbi:SigE family RNA polymerase sigma factor [Serinicoccus kebangsaanensis]|uniref:SigE family RNA polymerase sigma factor n=1 Tax=Serinicoccus kebangsaanensis TaxID=2602069 RepID=UPI00124EFBE3|nr:SigE family RNA polymerase sigma factor [Serinicoccus kebangsaanensis]